MSFISNQNNFFCEKHFVFLDNSILLEKSGQDTLLTIDNLPSEKTMRKFLQTNLHRRYAEPD